VCIDVWFYLQEVLADLQTEEGKVKSTIKKGDMILRFCHPSGTHTIQTLLNRLKKRWEELNSWANQRKTRLDEHLRSMEDERKLIEELSAWVKEKEAVIEEKEAVPLPEEDTDKLKALLDEHKVTYTSKNAQVVTNLQQTCSNAVPTTCQQDVFALLVPSLLTSCQWLVDNLLQGC
jgi:arsenate reductase-like glutaredoxin family protein